MGDICSCRGRGWFWQCVLETMADEIASEMPGREASEAMLLCSTCIMFSLFRQCQSRV